MPLNRVLFRNRSLAPGMVDLDAIISNDGALAVEGKGVTVAQPGGAGNPYVLTLTGEGSLDFASITTGVVTAEVDGRYATFTYSESARTVTLSFFDDTGTFQDLGATDEIHVHIRVKNSSGR